MSWDLHQKLHLACLAIHTVKGLIDCSLQISWTSFAYVQSHSALWKILSLPRWIFECSLFSGQGAVSWMVIRTQAWTIKINIYQDSSFAFCQIWPVSTITRSFDCQHSENLLSMLNFTAPERFVTPQFRTHVANAFDSLMHFVLSFLYPCQDGFTYERTAISAWFQRNDTSPLTTEKLTSRDLQPNLMAKQIICAFFSNNF